MIGSSCSRSTQPASQSHSPSGRPRGGADPAVGSEPSAPAEQIQRQQNEQVARCIGGSVSHMLINGPLTRSAPRAHALGGLALMTQDHEEGDGKTRGGGQCHCQCKLCVFWPRACCALAPMSQLKACRGHVRAYLGFVFDGVCDAGGQMVRRNILKDFDLGAEENGAKDAGAEPTDEHAPTDPTEHTPTAPPSSRRGAVTGKRETRSQAWRDEERSRQPPKAPTTGVQSDFTFASRAPPRSNIIPNVARTPKVAAQSAIPIGADIKVFWEVEKEWFPGTVEAFNPWRKYQYMLRYDDGDVEWCQVASTGGGEKRLLVLPGGQREFIVL